jgi:hypothetical protein
MFVSRKSPGAFILSRKGRSADFVGASTRDVGAKIRQLSKPASYRYFWYAYTDTAEEALHLEMRWVHRFCPTDNQAPPSRSPEAGWRCTTEGCATCALTVSGR